MTGWMITFAYLVLGAFYSRAVVRRWARDPESMFAGGGDSFDRSGAAAGAIGVGLLWPIALVFYAIKAWLWKPVDRDAERLDRLRADRDAWRGRTNSTDPGERRMATDIVSTLDDILRRES